MKGAFWIALGSSLYQSHFNCAFNHFYLIDPLIACGMYAWGWKPLVQFEKNPDVNTAKNLKMNSYKHFMFFWLLVYGDVLYRKLFGTEERKEPEKALTEANGNYNSSKEDTKSE